MRFARRSLAFLKIREKNFNIEYVYNLINLLLKKGLKIRAYKIYKKLNCKIQFFINKLFKFEKNKGLNKKVEKFIKEEKEKNKFINFIQILNIIVNEYAPIISFVKRKVAANNYTLPYFISEVRSKMIFMRWFVKSSIDRYEKSISEKLYKEFLDILYGLGKTIKKIEEYYEKAKQNYPFIRFLKTKHKKSRLIVKKYHIRLKKKL